MYFYLSNSRATEVSLAKYLLTQIIVWLMNKLKQVTKIATKLILLMYLSLFLQCSSSFEYILAIERGNMEVCYTMSAWYC